MRGTALVGPVAGHFLDEHLDGLTDPVFRALCHQLVREVVELPVPAGDLLLVQLVGVGEAGRLRAVLVGVAEHADRVEPGFVQEQLKLLQVVGGLAGEADDEVGPHARVRGKLPDALDQVDEPRPVAEPAHPAQHRAARVLERQVEVGGHARRSGHDLDQAGPDLGGLQVAHADARDALGLRQLGQHRLKQPQVAEVLAVGGRVLADEHQLAHAVAAKPGGLLEQFVRPPGDERATEGRDRAERAAAVATGGDLQRGRYAAYEPLAQHGGARGGRDAGRQVAQVYGGFTRRLAADRAYRQELAAVPGHVGGPLVAREYVVEASGDVCVVIEAEHLDVHVIAGFLVYFVERRGEVSAVALGQAADGRDLGPRGAGAEHGVNGLLLGRVNEAARVDEDDVRVFPLAPQRPAARRKARGKLF